MFGRRDYNDFFQKKRRKGHSWQLIGLLFVAGVAFVTAALVFSKTGTEKLPNTSVRSLSVHSSSLDAKLDVKLDATKPAAENAKTIEDGVGTPEKPQFASKTKAEPRELELNAKLAAEHFLALAVSPGAMRPSSGKYAVSNLEFVYDKTAAPELVAAARSATYIVVSGDILGRIAQSYGCSIAQIQTANRLSNDQIKIGQKLLIPDCKSDQVVPLVEEAQNAPSATAKRGRWWKDAGVNTTLLPKLMKEEGFKPPPKFMAFVIELTFDETRQIVVRERAFDYNGSSSKNEAWNPASAIKTFAAIGALHRLDELGFTSRARVTFHESKAYTTTVGELIEAAIIHSDNIAYNRVVQLASYEKLHKEILTPRFGISNTALNRAYELSRWTALGQDASFRIAPAITLAEGKKTHKIEASHSKAAAVCSSAACTTLQDLGESTRRLMLQEQLPSNESFNLKHNDLLVLRRAMRSEERTRGTEMVDIFSKNFGDSRVKFYSKPGFSEDWFTDNVYIFDPRYNQAWIVVMSGYPGRKTLDSAAQAISKLISSGKLRKN